MKRFELVATGPSSGLIWGVGLRPSHFADWHQSVEVPVLELMADNLLHHEGGPALWHSLALARRAPSVVLHGIGLNIGGADELSLSYLDGLRKLVKLFSPLVVSDHLCFTKFNGRQSYELLPLVRNRAMLEHVAQRVDQVQQFLGCRYSLENVSAYVEFKDDRYSEGEFLSEISSRTGCGILLDVNNIFVNAKNFNRDPDAELGQYDLCAVTQLHVAGHSSAQDFLFDTHDTPVCEKVWQMLAGVLERIENDRQQSRFPLPVILENDHADTPLSSLNEEIHQGRRLYELSRSS